MICVDSFPGGDGPARDTRPGGRSRKDTARGGRTRRNRPQPHAFWKGAAIALFPLIPMIGAAIWLLARLGVGNATAGPIEVLRLSVVFAGPAALLTAGGVGRLAAEAGAEGGRKRAAWVGGRTMAVAGAGLGILAAIPQGDLPIQWPGWAAVMGTGALVGAAGGVLIGLVVGAPLPTLTELGVPERYQVDPLDVLRRAGQRARRATRRGTGRLRGKP